MGLSGITFAFSAVVFNFLLYITTPAIAAAVAQEDRDKVQIIPNCRDFLEKPSHHVKLVHTPTS